VSASGERLSGMADPLPDLEVVLLATLLVCALVGGLMGADWFLARRRRPPAAAMRRALVLILSAPLVALVLAGVLVDLVVEEWRQQR